MANWKKPPFWAPFFPIDVRKDERQEHDEAPRQPEQPRAEMAQVGVERLGTRHAKERAPEHHKVPGSRLSMWPDQSCRVEKPTFRQFTR